MSNRITKILGIEKPIVQAAMHTITNAEMVAAVSNAGGLGILDPNAGWTPKMSEKDAFLGALPLMKEQIEKTKKLTDKPFGAEVAFPEGVPADSPQNQKITHLIIDEKVPVVLVFNYVTKEIVDLFHKHNIKVLYRDYTPTAESTKKAVSAGVDIIIATGFDEGGSIPTKVVGTFSIVPLVVDNAGDVPVLAAGGVADARTVKAAFALGAEGVYVGTAFMASKEAPVAQSIKEKIVKYDADDVVMFRAVPKFYRSIKGELPDKLVKLDDEGKSGKEIFKVAGAYSGMLKGLVKGDLENGWATVGTDIGLIHKIDNVENIINRLYAGVPEDQH